jgi:hypothetical protein
MTYVFDLRPRMTKGHTASTVSAGARTAMARSGTFCNSATDSRAFGPLRVADSLIAKTTRCGNSQRVAGRAEGSTPFVKRSLCDNPMEASPYSDSVRNICCAALVAGSLPYHIFATGTYGLR